MNHAQRPVNLDLTKFKFPATAILSISHRISGVLMFLFLPLAIYLLHASSASHATFAALVQLLQNFWLRLAIWLGSSVTLFHLMTGIRHLLMDCGLWESLGAGRASAYIVFALGLVVTILMGVWIW